MHPPPREQRVLKPKPQTKPGILGAGRGRPHHRLPDFIVSSPVASPGRSPEAHSCHTTISDQRAAFQGGRSSHGLWDLAPSQKWQQAGTFPAAETRPGAPGLCAEAAALLGLASQADGHGLPAAWRLAARLRPATPQLPCTVRLPASARQPGRGSCFYS